MQRTTLCESDLLFQKLPPDARASLARPVGKETPKLNAEGKYAYPFGQKSSGLKICRTSVSPSQPGQCCLWSSMNCTAPSMASSFDLNSKIANPPTTSLPSANGPSNTATLPPA